MKRLSFLLPLALLAASAQAGEMIYQPINPSFGGDPLNGNYLLNKAQAQDNNKDPDAADYGDFSETDFFLQDLRDSLTNKAIEDAIEDADGGSGSVINNSQLKIEIVSIGNGGFEMNILDKRTGETTTVNFGTPNF